MRADTQQGSDANVIADQQAGFDALFGGAEKTTTDTQTSEQVGNADDLTAGAGAQAAADDGKQGGNGAQPEAVSDEWEGVPPAVRKYLEGINHQFGALTNEVKASTGRIARIQSDLDKARTVAAQAPNTSPTDKQITDAASSGGKWNQLKDDFPEWAEAVDERLAAERAERSTQQQPAVDVESIRSEAAQEGRQLAVLDVQHPDWEQMIVTDEFRTWHRAQPPEVQALAKSPLAKDAGRMLSLFADHRKSQEAAHKRQTQLGRAAPVRSTAGPTHRTTSEKDDAERAFAEVFDS